MNCKCTEFVELMGNEAINYAEQHLVEISSNSKTWESEYKCPITGIHWLLDYPHGEYHGGGSPRLRKLDEPIKN